MMSRYKVYGAVIGIVIVLWVAIAWTGILTRPQQAKDVLRARGYEDVEVTGYAPLSCAEEDMFRTGFTATSPEGGDVSGAVCSGVWKGSTVRFD
jgi:hypothetical protein